MVRDCRYATGDRQKLQTCYSRWSETADMLREMFWDSRHTTGDGQGLKLQTCYKILSETADMFQKMVSKDCRHATWDGQALQALYRRWSETVHATRKVRDCRHTTGMVEYWGHAAGNLQTVGFSQKTTRDAFIVSLQINAPTFVHLMYSPPKMTVITYDICLTKIHNKRSEKKNKKGKYRMNSTEKGRCFRLWAFTGSHFSIKPHKTLW